MENVNVPDSSPFAVTGNTRLISAVPVPYFSYHDFGVLEPRSPKTEKSLAAAYISNCSFKKRNEMVLKLQQHGVAVDSYGSCVHNKDESASRSQRSKIEKLRGYKFSLAFENSETDDYVTEKFFGSLCAGSVPVVIGAPNTKMFAPDSTPYPYQSHAMIHAADFDFDPEKLAAHLLYLDRNNTAYEEYLAWKKTGYTDDFRALWDLTDVTSDCRACTMIADSLRFRDGANAWDTRFADEHTVRSPSLGGGASEKTLYVRERGVYGHWRVHLSPITLEALVGVVLEHIKPREKNLWLNNMDYRGKPTRVYAFVASGRHSGRVPILSDAEVQALPDNAELDVIFV